MAFSPSNNIVQLCLQGMAMEDMGQPAKAATLFLQGWSEATDNFEKYLAAYYVARHQKTVTDQLKWLEAALEYALKVNDDAVRTAFPALHRNIAQCYEALGNMERSAVHTASASLYTNKPSDNGPFYHGTKAELEPGDFLTAGGSSNYQTGLEMNHIYFTALINGAGLAAELAKGNGEPMVYIVEPTGSFESDPNVTDKKFPGNPTRSYRSKSPLKIIGETKDWIRLAPAERQGWQEKVTNNKGEIIN